MVDVVAVATRGVLATDAAVLCGVAAAATARRKEPGAVPFTGAAITLAVAAVAVGVLGEVGGPRSLSWAVLASLLLVFVAGWLWFVLGYTGVLGLAGTGAVPALAAIPALGVVTVVFLYVSGDPIPRLPTARGPVYLVFFSLPMVLVGAAFLGSVLALLRTGHRYVSADFARSVALAVGAVGGVLLPLLVVSMDGAIGADPVPGFAMAGAVAGGGFGLATWRYDLFESVPTAEAVGRDSVVAAIDDLVLVVDRDERVVDLNRAAAAALGVDVEAAAGDPVQAILGVSDPVTALETVELGGEEGRHVYAASVSEVADDSGRVVGHALVLRDVTDRQTRQQRLAVLNRVLRHNVRNDMTAVMGYADLLADEADEATAIVERIHETADALTELGDKAREIEQIMAASAESGGRTDLDRIAQYVASETRTQYPEATVTLDLGAGPVVDAPEDVCWPICWNLVENAIDHHDGEPTVTIATRVDAAEDRAVLAVADDGPGIPDTERRAIATGTEEPLSHGSGLGLWAVKWGANRVGGEVTIADADPRGTRVTVRLPLAETGTATAVPDRE